jgi:hypothetical protein
MELEDSYRVHKRPPLVPILNQLNPVNILKYSLFKTNFNIIYVLLNAIPAGYLPNYS